MCVLACTCVPRYVPCCTVVCSKRFEDCMQICASQLACLHLVNVGACRLRMPAYFLWPATALIFYSVFRNSFAKMDFVMPQACTVSIFVGNSARPHNPTQQQRLVTVHNGFHMVSGFLLSLANCCNLTVYAVILQLL